MIDLTENTYVLGIWSVQGVGSDWLCAVTREGDDAFTMLYRFRYYRDDHAFDSEDEKVWYKTKIPKTQTEDQIIAVVDSCADGLCRKGYSNHEPWRRIIRGGAQAAVDALKEAPFIHIQERAVD